MADFNSTEHMMRLLKGGTEPENVMDATIEKTQLGVPTLKPKPSQSNDLADILNLCLKPSQKPNPSIK